MTLKPTKALSLSDHGITEIVILGHHKMDSTTKTQTLEQFNVKSEGGATLSGYDLELKRDPMNRKWTSQNPPRLSKKLRQEQTNQSTKRIAQG